MLFGALRQEVVADTGADQEKTVPGLADGGDDALVAPDAYFYLVNALGQAHVQGEADGLGAFVDENSADGRVDLLRKLHAAIVCRAARLPGRHMSRNFQLLYMWSVTCIAIALFFHHAGSTNPVVSLQGAAADLMFLGGTPSGPRRNVSRKSAQACSMARRRSTNSVRL
jgi:hypothetical protein